MEAENADIDDEMAEPPLAEFPRDHELWPEVAKVLRSIYDPEISISFYELGLLYKVEISPASTEGNYDIYVEMSLTTPACPFAAEMPIIIQNALMQQIEQVENAEVEVVWEPMWNPAMMADTAKLHLNLI